MLPLTISYLLGQETNTILNAPDDWNSEKILFPLEFAPEIDFKGFEDIRFAPGWSDVSSKSFWTYHFSWYIEKVHHMSEDLLTEILIDYYDGLSKAVLRQQQNQTVDIEELDRPQCLLLKTDEGFRGK